MLIRNTHIYRLTSLTVLIVMVMEVIVPATALALTSGPSQPEFSSFEPVATTSMVNEFDGSFSYNLPVLSIPGPNGGGYALSLSYHNATSVEEEASWVGYGWTLNPGAISRQTRGFPDDYKNAKIQYWNKVRPNWTVTATKRLGLEVASGEIGGSVGGYYTQRYNNYRGYGYTAGVSLGIMGVASIDYSETDGKSSWGVSVSPMAILAKLAKSGDKPENQDADQESTSEKTTTMQRLKSRMTSALFNSKSYSLGSRSGLFGVYQLGDYQQSLNSTSFDAETWMGGFAAECDALPALGIEGGVGGSYAIQTTKNKEDRYAYGYMYSYEAQQTETGLMDYFAEKDAPFQKRDRYLYLPFSNPDQFIVSGEGLGGGFRLQQRNVGHYRPNKIENSSIINNINLDVHLCAGLGGGIGAGHGDHSTTIGIGGVSSSADGPYLFADPSTEDEPYFFRFAGDMGGSLLYSDDDNANTSYWTYSPLALNASVWNSANQGKRVGRSSYIGYTLNSEVRYGSPYFCGDGVYGENKKVNYRAYAKQSITEGDENYHRISQHVDQESAGQDGIAEFGITKENGTTYVYGLPVYSIEESNFQFGLHGLSAESIEDNYVAYKYVNINNPGSNTIVGDIKKAPYASSYLMTEILSPDYVDRTNDGPTLDDIGGYVKFNYDKKAGTARKSRASEVSESQWQQTLDEEWYRWRTPYRGLHYRRNAMSDPFDDVGTVSSGYKEIYYVESIETKTHKAIFYTSPRKDGYSAQAENVAAVTGLTEVSSETEPDPDEQKQLFQLDKIELFAKDAEGNTSTLLQTVHFEYDFENSLCQGLPNAESDGSNRLGKLTLKRVWFEYEGAVSARISPYEFGYEYRQIGDYPSTLQTRYPDICNYAYGLSPTDQNPVYNPMDIDRWGNYQKDGALRFAKFQQWVDQSPPSGFDPAAWQLKWIRLPSGGEIQIQYEQHDYRYVQHRQAMAMVSLATTGDEESNVYHLNYEELGYANPSGLSGPAQTTAINDLKNLKAQIYDLFVTRKEYIYLRFLYALKGSMQQNDGDLSTCRAEYITGYASVEDVVFDDAGGSPTYQLRLTIGDDTDPDDPSLPRQLCFDYVRANRAGIVQTGNCDASEEGVSEPNGEDEIADRMIGLFGDFGDPYVDENNDCKEISLPNSYVRIPLTKAKLGGGIRVKRLLMVDDGLEGDGGDDVALYGTEYEYKTLSGGSSGVATNEPSGGREENALIGYLKKRRGQNDFERIFSGEDRDQFEGPLGESLLPGPSIGYSRVVVKNIHQVKTGTGYAVHEFYTARDYPFDLTYASFDGKESELDMVKSLGISATEIRGSSPNGVGLDLGLAALSADFGSKRQGYRFVLNGMHGKPMKLSTYAGTYGGNDTPLLIEENTYRYYQPGEKIPVMTGPDANDAPGGTGETDISYADVGKEMEVVMESRRIEDIGNNVNGQADFGAFLAAIFAFPFGSAHASYNRSESIFNTHVTTKVVKYPAIQKSLTTYKDGVTTVTENAAFDPVSGRPILVKHTDGFDGLVTGSSPTPRDGTYYTVSLPAHRYYSAMGQIAHNQRLKLGGVYASGYTLDKRFYGDRHYLLVQIDAAQGASQVFDYLHSGDLVELNDAQERLGVYHVGAIAGNRIELLPTSYSRINDYPERRDVTVEVIRSANTNQVMLDVGSFTTYGKAPEVTKDPLPNP